MTKNILISAILLLTHFSTFTQPPVVNGWTSFQASSDTRIIYVSNSEGDDFTAHFYMPDDAAVGSDPFLPSGTILAFKTIAGAMTQLRDGYPDWILLKNGDVFQNQDFGIINLSGRSSTEPMLFATYGPSGQRPQILTAGQPALNIGYYFDNNICNYLAFCGLHMEPTPRPSGADPSAINIFADFDKILFEDCFVSNFFTGMAVLDPAGNHTASRTNLTIRRSTFCDAYTTGTAHTGGIFINNVDTILFEENLVDHNGWHDSIPGAMANGFRHNTYFQVGNKNLTFRDNISSRASATGGGHRCGGIITGNLYLSNPQNLQFGTHETTIDWPSSYVSGEIAYNIVLDARIEPFDAGRGIRVQRAKNTHVHHNIIAHFTSTGTYNLGLFFDEAEGIQCTDNIVYKWGNNMPAGPAYSSGMALGFELGGINTFANNDIQMLNSKGYCINSGAPFSNVSFSLNRYYNINPTNNWFQPGGNFSTWTSLSSEIGGQMFEVPYLDPERNLTTYLATLGISGGLQEFIAYRRAMNKNNWNSDFTAPVVNAYIREGFAESGSSVNFSSPPSEPLIKLYPNPTTGLLHISSQQTVLRLQINSILGELLFDVPGNDQLSLDISELPSGVYLLNAQDKSGAVTSTKFVKL